MVTFVPGTLESDPKKIVMSLQQVGPRLDGAVTDIASNTADIATNTADIATNTADIATNTANIATNTADISTLQTKTNGYEAAWTAYTPTITAGSGSFTTVSATGRYLAIGKTIHLSVTVTITTNGTAATSVRASLPANVSASGNYVIAGRGNALSGNLLMGRLAASSTTLDIFNYNNSYPGSSGEVLMLSGIYEAA